MKRIRIVISSNDSGSMETVYFTDDLHSPVGDLIQPGLDLVSDTIINDTLPTMFPREYVLTRV
uniref:Uncharacterized protein n=1 Tax=viral metagenome TaxID=1070528 RepID=A0A6M3LS88_9ZZZZ